MKINRTISAFFITLFSGIVLISCQQHESKKPYLLGQGTGIGGVTLMVNDIEAATTYFKDSLGFNIRGKAEAGEFEGSLVNAFGLSDMSGIKLLSLNDSVEENTIPAFIKTFLAADEGVRLYALSTSSADSAFMALNASGYAMDSVQSYRDTSREPKGWSRDDGDLTSKSLDFDAAAPPAYLPRFTQDVGTNYTEINDSWRTYYVYNRMYNKQPNGVVGMAAIRIVVSDLKTAGKDFEKMGLELIEQNETIFRFRVARNQELHLLAADSDPAFNKFFTERGAGVFGVRFEVEDLDSTYSYFEKELPTTALTKTAEQLSILPEYAYGVQMEFVQEPDDQGLMVRQLSFRDGLDSVAVLHAGELYTKYCALCHGDDRQGYVADNAPSLRSKSLLATSKKNNFMRYTIQYGRANTAMGGYLNTQGGPMEYIEVELLLEYLYQLAEVEEAIDVSREPVVGDIALGASLYQETCAVCHGANGEGVTAPALGNPMLLATATDHFLRYAIAEGRDGTPMIAFKDSLSSEEIDGLTAFLRSRASGWDVPESDSVKVPTPEEYVLNPDGKDPVFELREGKYVSSEQVNRALEKGEKMIILDARSEVAWRQMHIPGAIPVPYYEEPENFIDDIPNDGTQIVIYCACPHAASGRVQSTLKRHGFKNTAIIDEGILVWAQMGFPVRNGS
jgi:mono/diheme cytochrome c family protein/rhodanese-related sulfurtransferase/4-hydroxyphenylpyruvate dioxygenase-like putative hemolysin